MTTTHVNDLDIEYLTAGDPTDPALLLVTGVGLQLTSWPQGFVDRLVDSGLFVICFDNRDSGLSSKLAGLPDLGAVLRGDASSAAYLIDDMADDAAGLLAALDITRAHVAGMSMGGMITQALVIRYPTLFSTACSIMSTTGDPTVGAPTAEAATALLRPPAANREEAIAGSIQLSRLIGSPKYPMDEELLRERATGAYDRCYCPDGTARQVAAALASPDRTEGLHGVRIPFLVIHGEDDPIVAPSGGHATAAAVPSARLLTFPGMGHDLPVELWEEITDAIVSNTVQGQR